MVYVALVQPPFHTLWLSSEVEFAQAAIADISLALFAGLEGTGM